MIWYFLSQPLAFVFFFFFKSIRAVNKAVLLKPGPALLILNHPSAYTDPIAFTYVFFPLRTRYLAGGVYFRNRLASFFLNQLGIVPIYRLQDAGKSGLKNNDETHARVVEALKKGQKVMVFAEGVSVQERRLKPIKKGMARLAFIAQEALGETPLRVIPVGVNYSDPSRFRSTLVYRVGEPIAVTPLMSAYREHPAKAQSDMIQQVYKSMLPLIIHVDNSKCQSVIPLLEKLLPGEIQDENIWQRSASRAKILNALTMEQQADLEQKSAKYINACIHLGIKEVHAPPKPYSPFFAFCKLLLLGFFAWPGIMLQAPVVWFSRKFALTRVKYIEFYTSVLLTLTLLGGMLWHAVFFTLGYLYSGSVFIGYCTFLSVLACGIISVSLIDHLRFQWQNWKWFRLSETEKRAVLELKNAFLQDANKHGLSL